MGEHALPHVHIVLTILFLTFLSGVLVCGVSLVSEMCRVNPETLSHFRRVSEWLADVFAFLMYHSTVLLLSSVYSTVM